MQSVLGSVWAVLNPLALILVYTIIFSQVMKSRLPGIDDPLAYSVYLCAGIIPWNYFLETLTRSQNVFLEQSNLLKKVSFPRTALPMYVLISASINFLIIFSLFIIFLIIKGDLPGVQIIGIIPLLFLQQIFAVGFGVFLGTINIFFRDVGHAVGIITQFWFWLTPIIYPLNVIPESLKPIFNINPMVPIIKGYQGIFLHHQWPQWNEFLSTIIVSFIFLIIGYMSYKKLEKEMVDEL